MAGDSGGGLAGLISIYLACWSIRRSADLDFRLSRRAQVLRWSLVTVAYVLVQIPGPRFSMIRLLGGMGGVAVWCWPNLAYRIDRSVFHDWPETEATVESAEEGSGFWQIQYSFEYEGERRGGRDAITGESPGSRFTIGKNIRIAFDPLNATESKIATSSSLMREHQTELK